MLMSVDTDGWCRLESLLGQRGPHLFTIPWRWRWVHCLFVVKGNRNERTGEMNSDVQNHQKELMRCLHLHRDKFGSSARPGQANAACYCGEVERLTFILSITSEPSESCYVWNRAHHGAPVTAGCGPLSLSTTGKPRDFHVFVCVVCRRSSELHSLQT